MSNKVDMYKKVFESSSDAIIIFDEDGFINCNEQTAKYLGLKSVEDFKTLNPFEIIPPYQPDGSLSHIKYAIHLEECINSGEARFKWLYKTLKDEELYVSIVLKKLDIDSKTVFVAKWTDENEIKELEQDIKNKTVLLNQKKQYIEQISNVFKDDSLSADKILETIGLLNEYKKVIDETSIVSKANRKGVITFVNDKFCEISGYSKEELVGSQHSIIRHPSMKKEVFEELWRTILNKEIFKGVIVNKAKDGSAYYVDTTIVPVLNERNEIIEFIAIRHDITKIYEQEVLIQEQYTDELTKLPNRQRLLKDLKESISSRLVLIDIGRFRDINDAYGFDVGDMLLKEFANFIKRFGNVYRLSNNLFAYCEFLHIDDEEFKDFIYKMYEEINNKKFYIDNNRLLFNIVMSVGRSSNTKSRSILTETEFGLRLAKEKKEHILFLEQHISKIEENQKTIQILKDVVEKEDILVYGQKIVHNITCAEKYETLMRIKLEDGTIASPFKFLEVAKKTDLYLPMTRIIVKKACNYFKGKNIDFNINLTMEDISDEYTMDFIFDVIENTNTGKQLTFEIVESEGIDDFSKIEKFIKRARSVGCKIAVDDFGTGYSNFEYIIRLNIDFLKIDGSLIKTIHIDKNLELTVKAIVNFAKSLGIKIVAEFVHNIEVLNKVQELDIDYSQGYYLHAPEELV